MHQKFLMIPVVFAALAGLMAAAHAAESVDPENSARVRVYQEADITLYPGEYCYGSDNPAAIHASASLFSMLGMSKREGMPETGDIPGSYSEYVIQAGKPVTVMLQWQAEKDGVQARCGPLGSTFFPQAGKSYDVTMGYAGNCFVQIRELYETSPGKAGAKMAASIYSFACAGK